jgi:hypothetical protein
VPPLVGLWLLGALQLVLLPRGLHRLLAPGSAAVWYPSDPVAAAVLGGGAHPISLDPEATARWLALTTGLVALALLAAPALRERRATLRAAIAIVIGAMAVAVYALVARLAFGDKLYGFLAVPTIAPFGPFVSKNHFAGYVEIAACLAVGLAAGLADEARRGPERLSWLESSHSGRVVFAWGAAGALVLVVPLSLSRGGVVSLAAGLVVFAALRVWVRRSGRTSPRTLAFAVSALAIVAIAVALVLPPEATARLRTLGGITTDSAGSYRIAIDALAPARGHEPDRRVGLRRIRGRDPALQDRRRRSARRTRRERLPRTGGGRRPRGRPAGGASRVRGNHGCARTHP